jgi:hypothetical protein
MDELANLHAAGPPERKQGPVRIPGPRWLGLTAVVAFAVSVGITVATPIYRRHAALRGIDRSWGRVRTISLGPEWLRRLVGEKRMRWFEDVQYLDLSGLAFTDVDVIRLESLPNLKELILDGTTITDAGAKGLLPLTRLERLSLAKTQLSDAGLSHLALLPNLQSLDINYTQVSDGGLPHLAQMTNLKKLWINETRVTRASASELNDSLPNRPVQWVGLWKTASDPFGVLNPSGKNAN